MPVNGSARFLACLCCAIVALEPNCAQAQDAGPRAGEPGTIIVTARRADEAASEVPLKLSVIPADAIAAGSVESLQSLAARIPGVTFEAIWGGANAFPIMRGQNLPSVAGDAVGMFVDGVYQANRDAIDVAMLDLERIEVVQGPQSALFGHSTFAGLIAYVPAPPGEQAGWAAHIDGGIGQAGGGTMLSTPIDGTFKGRVAASWQTARGSWRNRADGHQSLGNLRQAALAATLATREAAGPLALRLTGRYSESQRNQPAFFALDHRTFNCGGRDTFSGAWSYYCGEAPRERPVSLSTDVPDSASRSGQLALHLALDLGSATLRSDSSYYQSRASSYRDFDGSAEGELFGVCEAGINCTGPGSLVFPVVRTQFVNIVQRRTVGASEATQELRLEGGDAGPVRWMTGITAYRTVSRSQFAYGAQRGALAANERFTALILTNPARVGVQSAYNFALADDPAANQTVQNLAVEHRRTLAAFATLDWNALPGLDLRGEIRGNWQRVVLDSRTNNFQPSFGTAVPPRRFFDLTGRLGLAWKPEDGWLLYASRARGSRSGGINAAANLTAAEQIFEPEYNWTSELGAKFSGPGLLQSLEITGYHIDWSNTQINGLSTSPGVTALILRNTRGVHIRGVDLAAKLRPADWLGLALSGGYTDPRFKHGSEDPGSSGVCGLNATTATSSFCTIRPSLVNPGQIVPDISGMRVLRAAKLVWAGEATIAPGAAWLHGARLTLSFSHQGNVFERNVNALAYGRRNLLDARIALPLGNWSLSLWGTNLTGQRYIRAAAGRPPLFYPNQPRPSDMILGEGRRIGATLRIAG